MNTLQNWDSELDKQIIEIIERDVRAYFYRLWKELKVSRNTLNLHLDTMLEQGVIEKDPIKQIGKKRYIQLTKACMDARRLGVFRGVIREPTNTEKRIAENTDVQIQNDMRLLVLLLLRAATGITNLRPTMTPEIKEEYLMMENLKGVSVEDIIKFQENIDLLANNNIFTHLGFSKQKINFMLNTLKDELNRYPDFGPIFNLVPFITCENSRSKHRTTMQANYDSITFSSRFELVSSFRPHLYELKKFLVYCDTVLMFVISRMEMKWYSGERPRRKEVEWYEYVFGREISNSFFLNKLKVIRVQLYKRRVLKDSKSKHNRDIWVKHFYTELFSEKQKKFKNIEKKYPMFYKIVTDIVYPRFLRRDIELSSLNKRAVC